MYLTRNYANYYDIKDYSELGNIKAIRDRKLEETKDGVYVSEEFYFGDAALDYVFYYEHLRFHHRIIHNHLRTFLPTLKNLVYILIVHQTNRTSQIQLWVSSRNNRKKYTSPKDTLKLYPKNATSILKIS